MAVDNKPWNIILVLVYLSLAREKSGLVLWRWGQKEVGQRVIFLTSWPSSILSDGDETDPLKLL